MLMRPYERDALRVDRYEPSTDARLNYLQYLLAEPQMDVALETMAALGQDQRQVVIAFLRTLTPDEPLDIADQQHALLKRRAA
ncbi:MAG TPA: hypothetical protein VND97_09045 [Beijerinckiaceae bacterium]|nr:hypothetical protein [Beijerinckiaceae bacterium]